MARLHNSVSGVVRLFAFCLVNRTLPLDLLQGVDYSDIFIEPSMMERVFAIHMNCLEVDAKGEVVNADHAQRRAAQFIRHYFDQGYRVDPPFEEWETDLHI